MPRLIPWAITILATSSLFVSACLAEEADRAAISERLDALQHISAQYTIETDMDFDPALAPLVANQQPQNHPGAPHLGSFDPKRQEIADQRFFFTPTVVRMETSISPATAQYWSARYLPYIAHDIKVISMNSRVDGLFESVSGRGRKSRLGGIDAFTEFPEDWTIDLALGLRLYGGRAWLSQNDLANLKIQPSSIPGMVDAHLDYGKGSFYLFRFDPQHAYALIYCRDSNDPDSFVEITNSDFVQIKDQFLPQRIIRRTQYTDTAGQRRHPFTRILTIHQYLLDNPSNTPDSLAMIWPAYSRILDTRLNKTFPIGPTSRPITDADILMQVGSQALSNIVAQTKSAIKQLSNPATSPASPIQIH